MAEEDKGTSSWYKVPTWSGNPGEWRAFKKEMSWWIASLDFEASKKYNVAARWALRQYGVVRARCEEFEPEELEGIKEEKSTDPESGEPVILVEADPFAGSRKLMKACAAMLVRGSRPIARGSGQLQLSSSEKGSSYLLGNLVGY